MKSKKLTMIAFLMFLAVGSQKLQASSEFTFDKHGVGIDRVGNRYHSNADGSDVIKMVTGILRKANTSGHALDYNDVDAGWKMLKVADKNGNALGRFEVDPQGVVGYPRLFSTDPVKPIEDPVKQILLNELAAKLDAIEVPAHL
ncbi:hypothetical protein [Candidatus Chromulinivorax destructor]|uniref:Uncharacterized protein n=1 Tax=Candidatus Chromulinivorax destructor TaxID=2066483 RepID=A0A345ZC61_9BACT|nr:hypothetical protein [Candidatus Chromulinivorax destructor]AXK60878.1 hypothetical protein C0J27_03985 [Candidatus Chromulinivorax destructor]